MTSWIEPPPKQKGTGCLGKGCMTLVVFIILLAVAFFIGGYVGVRYVVTSTEPRPIPQIETSEAEQQAVQTRWEEFQTASNSSQPQVAPQTTETGAAPTPVPLNRIELTAGDINQLIAASRKARGKAFVYIENNILRAQISVPLDKAGFRGRFINGELQIKPAPDGNPRNAEITEVSAGGVSDKVLNTLLGFRSLRSYADQYASEWGVTSFTIEGNKVIIENGGRSIPGFNR
jgi:hypothetical protein